MHNNKEESLDPDDWEATRALAHRMVDEAVEHLAKVRERPVWVPMPDDVRARLQTSLPMDPAPLDEVYGEYRENVATYAMGNVHPRFWGWYMGAINFTGALGDFLAAVEGSNLGGGNTGAAQVEQQVVDWLKEIAGFPKSASGTLTSGGSMANLVAHTVIRNLAAGYDVRKEGIAGLKNRYAFTRPIRCIVVTKRRWRPWVLAQRRWLRLRVMTINGCALMHLRQRSRKTVRTGCNLLA